MRARLTLSLAALLVAACNHPEPVVPPPVIVSPGGSAVVAATYRLASIDERRMPTAHVAGQVAMDSVILRLFDDGFFQATPWFGTRAQTSLAGTWGNPRPDSITFAQPGLFGGLGGVVRGDSLFVVGLPALGLNARYAYVRR